MKIPVRPCIIAASLAVSITLAGCSGREGVTPDLARYHSKGVPDEFAVVVYNRITTPDRTTTLPEPGTSQSRARQDPEAIVDRVLGGQSASRRDARTPAADAGLLSHMATRGIHDDIRRITAQEDLRIRRANPGRLLERVFRTDIYYRAYEDMTLDPAIETERLLSSGYRVLAPPPDPV